MPPLTKALLAASALLISLSIVFLAGAPLPTTPEPAHPRKASAPSASEPEAVPEKIAEPVIQPVSVTPSHLINIFEKEPDLRPPFDFTRLQQPQFPEKNCVITAYGAVGDGKSLNTQAFAAAIRDCVAQGGGTVEVPAGKWVTGAIRLESDINLRLDKDAVVIFSKNPKDYLPTAFSRYEGVEYNGFSPFIYATHAKNVAITGPGKLDGQGKLWWPKNDMDATYALYDMGTKGVPAAERVFDKESLMLRPSFIQFENSESILLEDFTVLNSPMWTVHPLYSSDILMRNIHVDTLGLNTDGIAIDSSRNVVIENSTVRSGDDAIVIKAGRDLDGQRVNRPSENIVIRNCTVLDGHGGLSLGSETSGSIRNVFAYGNTIRKATFGARIKSSVGRGGVVENIWISGLTAYRTNSECIQITTDYDPPRTPNDTAEPTFRNLHFDNIRCTRSSGSIIIKGLSDNPISDVSFKNVTIASRSAVSISSAYDITFSDSVINNRDKETTYQLSDTRNVTFSGQDCSRMGKNCVEKNRENR